MEKLFIHFKLKMWACIKCAIYNRNSWRGERYLNLLFVFICIFIFRILGYCDENKPSVSTIQIDKVMNMTGDKSNDKVAYFMHLKAAEAFQNSGKYILASDDLIQEAQEIIKAMGISPKRTKPDIRAEVTLLGCKLISSSKMRIGPFGGVAQNKYRVEIKITGACRKV